jgi:adenosylmethionine-8-amino-7-oxononanoate aminotransferase
LACTAGLASLDLLLTDETNDKILKINKLHYKFREKLLGKVIDGDINDGMEKFGNMVGGDTNHGNNGVISNTFLHPKITDIRIQGTILAVELYTPEGTSYFSNIRDIAYQFFIKKGILIRPLGNLIYLLPPYCISEEDLTYIYGCIEEFLGEI